MTSFDVYANAEIHCLFTRDPTPHFCFVDAHIHPSDAVTVFEFSDAYSFGVPNPSTAWFRARCSTLGTGLRYTSNTVFETFPWPQSPTSTQISQVAEAAEQVLQCRAAALRASGETLTALYGDLPPVLRTAHIALDEAVGAAYGFENDALDPLAPLLTLNQACFERERTGYAIRGPGTGVG